MDNPPGILLTEDDFLLYAGFRRALYRHNAYRNSVSRYIWQNKWHEWYQLSGWDDWAVKEARKDFVPPKPLPEWSPEQWQALAVEYDRRNPPKVRRD